MQKINAALAGIAVVLCSATLIPAQESKSPAPSSSRTSHTPPQSNPVGGDPSLVIARPVDLKAREIDFAQLHPGTGIGSWEGHSSVYGRAFSQGQTAVASAENFRLNSLPTLGIDPQDVKPYARFLPENHPTGNTVPLMYNQDTGTFKFTAHYYTQEREGLEVYGTRLTLLTRNEPNNPLVLANVTLRDLPSITIDRNVLNQPNTQAAYALARVVLGHDMEVLTVPVPVIWAGINDQVESARLAILFQAQSGAVGAAGNYEAYEFVADAATGTILHKESLIHQVDVSGNVSANASTGHGADLCNGMAVMPLPYARVNIGATVAYADANGNFTIPNAGATPVTVEARLESQRFRVVNTATPGGGNSVLSQSVTPPGPANFLFNNPNVAGDAGQYKRAEVNAYIHAHKVRDLVIQYNPAFPSISTELNFPVNVNLGQTCNAFYSSANQSINFYVAGGTGPCTNTANGTVVHHEYGHRIVNAAGSGQGAYGEGFGDVMGVIVTDQPCLGQGFSPASETTPCPQGPASCSGCLRYANNTAQYTTTGCSSCGSAIHSCGRLISGCVWSVRNYLQASHPATYLDILRNLTVNSVLLHTGTTITPQITIDFLTLDDNDSDISNGTPHYHQINNGFTDHNMPGPPLIQGFTVNPQGAFVSSGLAGGPFNPSQVVYTMQSVEASPQDYQVTVNQPWLSVTNGAGTIAPNGNLQVTVALNANANALPNGLYNATISFTNLTSGLGNTSRNVNLEIGRLIYPASGLPTAVPDPGSMVHTINIPDAYCVGDVDVQVNVQHLSIGQLVLEVINPQGTVVRLHNRTGGTADHIVKTYDDTTTPPDGPGLLANFNGKVVTGDWRLRVADEVSGTAGSLASWSLRIIPQAGSCAPSAFGQSVQVPLFIASPITLSSTSASGGSVQTIIASLPANGSLIDPNGGTVASVPYTLLSGGNVIRYKPDGTFAGFDSFTFKANDGMDSNEAVVNVQVGGPSRVHFFPLDTDPGWTMDSAWQFGVPCGCGTTGRLDPAAGFTGSNVFGYATGIYPNNLTPARYLTSTAINCANLSGTQARFRRWLGVEHSTFDHARFHVSNDGVNWVEIWRNLSGSANTINEQAWSYQTYDISAVADGQATVYLRWQMGTTDGSVQYQGWNIDDIEVWGIRPPCPADTNADLVVNVNDLLNVINTWGPCNGCSGDVAPPGGDGQVNVNDLLSIINSWGSCP